MNIFFLSKDPIKAAQLQCDKHVVKMILESAQMLSTCHHANGTSLDTDVLYKQTHLNHPSSVWARASLKNYTWLYEHFIALCDEYTHRYGKVHLSDTKFRKLFKTAPFMSCDKPTTFTKPPKCMPDEYKVGSVVQSYQAYYYYTKRSFAKYTNRPCPGFML